MPHDRILAVASSTASPGLGDRAGLTILSAFCEQSTQGGEQPERSISGPVRQIGRECRSLIHVCYTQAALRRYNALNESR
jgi:hypothetical protein